MAAETTTTFCRVRLQRTGPAMMPALTLVALMLLAGCGSEPIAAPTAFATYQGKDEAFACDYPQDWAADGGGSRNMYWAKFIEQSAEIRVNTDLVGALFGSLARSTNQMAGTSDVTELSPVAQVHHHKLEQMQEQYAGYEEQNGGLFATGMGDAWSAEFTAKDTFGRPLRGYRTTALTRDLRITMICVCREQDWQTLEPAFDRVIKSLSAGK